MQLTNILFHPSVLYSKLIKKQAKIMVQRCQKRILMTLYISLYYKVSIASITVIFVALLF